MPDNAQNVMYLDEFTLVEMVMENFQVTILKPSSQETTTWSEFYAIAHSVMFVVDSADLSRMKETKKTLKKVISHPFIAGKPILMIANKQDKKETLNKAEVVEELHLEGLVNKYESPCNIIAYSALPAYIEIANKMMKDGQEWLFNVLDLNYEFIEYRVLKDLATQAAQRELFKRGRLLVQVHERLIKMCEMFESEFIPEEEHDGEELRSSERLAFDRGDELKAESRPEKNISAKPEYKEEPRYGEVLQKVEDISGLIPEEEPDTEEPQSPLWVLESVSSEDEENRGDFITDHQELQENIRTKPDGCKEERGGER
ncbi:ADP-ribosylation factor-like protein 13B [Takifugu rubripes]|uniref:ADP-ribosylation factor-like protein 13B n=1 Tax=Takifugu rubripes TaxID=31033 RepID=UPI001145C5BD|nr:ADP-ribosylation factor-like protein 13B [Takifugu rubripes]